MTDDLIARLSADLKPVPRHAVRYLLLGALGVGLVVAALSMHMMLGLRSDYPQAFMLPVFWTKFGYTLALAILGAVGTFVLSRPEGRTKLPWLGAGLLVILLAAIAFMQMYGADPALRHHLMMGGSAMVCPWYIVALSLPILAGVLLAMRQLAPGNPTLAGLAAGLFAGGAGAWVYSFHCGEDGMMFLLLWYSLGIAVVSALGAVIGRFVLRW
ncbi:DUF1109 domain-containing protein [Devosia sp.]|uniref:DUF1109 domain-containing protein n=1 Tax=Devosia sp. TaxID=1871048 RepID=UPI003264644A